MDRGTCAFVGRDNTRPRRLRAWGPILCALGIMTCAQAVQARVTAAQGTQAAQQLLGEAPGAAGFCGTALAVMAAEALAGADPLQPRLLVRALQRPALAEQVVSPSGHFRVHYETTGRDAVDPADEDANGIPDYVDLAAAVADSAWRLQVDSLGYRAPPSDGGAGGGDEVDIYLVDLGRVQNYGITYPMSSGATGPSYMQIDNDFTNSIYGNTFICPGHGGTRGADALRVTLAHEFFHVIQFGYYQGSDGSWFQEATATWMEDVAYPEIDDYLQYVCSFLQSPERALDSGIPSADFHAYGAAVFAHFLDQRYGRDVIRWIWEENHESRSARLDNMDRALRNYNGTVLGLQDVSDAGIESAAAEMAVWSWFVGERFREGFFAEGEKYDAAYVAPFAVAAKATTTDVGRIDHMSTHYMRFDPRLLAGGVTLDAELARGRWRRQLLLVSADGVEVRDVGQQGSIDLPGWDAWDDVVLVLTNVDVIGIGYSYEVMVEYDPDMIDAPAPLAMSLVGGAPNPFLPNRDTETVISFELSGVSESTRLTLFRASGERVRGFDLGPRAARTHSVRWDGTDDDGVLVASGIYYAVLEADGVARRAAVAVIRDR